MREFAVRVRLYPNAGQRRIISANLDAVRFVWNKALEMCRSMYREYGYVPSPYDMIATLPALKRVYPWLKASESTSLQQVMRHMSRAWDNHFMDSEHFGEPKFKSRKKLRDPSYTSMSVNGSVRVLDEHHIKIPKLGVVYMRGARYLDARVMRVTVRALDDGRYEATLAMRDDNQVAQAEAGAVCGVEVCVDTLLTTHDGYRVDGTMIRRRMLGRLHTRERDAARSKSGSKRHLKKLKRLARMRRHASDAYADAIHKVTAMIVYTYDCVCMERDMPFVKAENAYEEAAFRYEVLRQLWYKCTWYGVRIIEVPMTFDPRERCATCHNDHVETTRRGELYCPKCATYRAFDVNAAINIYDEGIRRMKRGTARRAGTDSERSERTLVETA